jgi:hypothetical protein
VVDAGHRFIWFLPGEARGRAAISMFEQGQRQPQRQKQDLPTEVRGKTR